MTPVEREKTKRLAHFPKQSTHLVVAMSSLGVASSSLAVSNMVRPKEVDSPPFTKVISWMKKSG